ncbi:MAG: hypothetical protein ACSW8B_04210 [bacterium]
MNSKNSSSKAGRVYRRGLFKRCFPLAVLALAAYLSAGALVFYDLFEKRGILDNLNGVDLLLSGCHPYILVVTVIFGFVVSLALQSDHHKSSSAKWLQSLPLSRNRMYGSMTIVGILILILPILAGTMILYLSAPYLNAHYAEVLKLADLNLVSVLSQEKCMTFALMTMLDALYVFMIGQFAGAMTGMGLFHMLMTVFIIGLPYITLYLADGYSSLSYYGLNETSVYTDLMKYLPLFGSLKMEGNYIAIALEITVAVMTYLFAQLLFLNAKVEKVGKPVIYTQAATVMSYFFTFIIMSCFLLYVPVIRSFDYMSHPKYVLMIAGVSSLVIFVILSMLMERTPKVIRLSLIPRFAIYLLCAGLILAVTMFDVLGISKTLPEAKSVDSVSISFDGMMLAYNNLDTEAAIKDVIALQKAFIDTHAPEESASYGQVSFTYEMKNGSSLMRAYTIYESHRNSAVEEAANKLFKCPEVKKAHHFKFYQTDQITLTLSDGSTQAIDSKDYSELENAVSADLSSMSFTKGLARVDQFYLTIGVLPAEDDGDYYEIYITSEDEKTVEWYEGLKNTSSITNKLKMSLFCL